MRRLALLVVAVLALAACTSDDENPSADPSPTPSATPLAAPAPPPPRPHARRLLPAVVRRGGRADQRGQPGRLRQGAHQPDLRGRPARPGRQRAPAGRRLRGRSGRRWRTAARPSSRRTSAPPRSSCGSRCCGRSGSPRPSSSPTPARLVPLRRHRGRRRRDSSPRSTATSSRRTRRRPRGAPSTACAAPPQPGTAAFERVLCREDHTLAGDLGHRPVREVGRRRYPGEEAVQERRRDRLRRRRPRRSPPTRSTTSGATSGRPRTSGRPARPTAGAGHPTRLTSRLDALSL